MRLARTHLALIVLALGSSSSAAAQNPPRKTATAHPTDGDTITIDGKLGEPAWSRATAHGEFIERVPIPNSEPPVRTRFRVLYDAETIYVGVESEMLPGETPRGFELTRDTLAIFSDDAISLKFDVRRDRRTTFGFVTNVAGTQTDYIAIENGRQFLVERDAVWEVETSVGGGWWIAEFRIPVAALGLPKHEGERVLGLNVTRDHNERRATYDWSHIPPVFGAVSAIHYGDVKGFKNMTGGRQLTLIPYALVGYREDDEGRLPRGTPLTLSAGLDARLRLGRDVWGELTVFTDFAQVDLDQPVVNLDRFPIFLPEKRRFFLAGLDVLDFGDTGNAQVFFSRQIGFDDAADASREVLMWGGLKAFGRAGPVGFGFLNVVTGDPTQDPTTNFSVGRVRYNFGEANYVGAIATVQADDQAGGADFAVGGDFSIRFFNRRLRFDGFAAGNFNDTPIDVDDRTPGGPASMSSEGAAAAATIRWDGEEHRPFVSALWIDDEFDPSVGFVRRDDLFRLSGEYRWRRRTETLGVERLDLAATTQLEWDQKLNQNIGRRGGGTMELVWREGWEWNATVEYVEDVVRRAFQQREGVTIEPGTYRGVLANLRMVRYASRNPSGNIGYTGQSGFFGGIRHTIDAEFNVSAGPHVRWGATAAISFVDLPEVEPFRTDAVNTSLTLAPNTTMFFDSNYQLNTFLGTHTVLARFRWRYLPGSDLFVVFRWNRFYRDIFDAPRRNERRVIVKATYRWDTLL